MHFKVFSLKRPICSTVNQFPQNFEKQVHLQKYQTNLQHHPLLHLLNCQFYFSSVQASSIMFHLSHISERTSSLTHSYLLVNCHLLVSALDFNQQQQLYQLILAQYSIIARLNRLLSPHPSSCEKVKLQLYFELLF